MLLENASGRTCADILLEHPHLATDDLIGQVRSLRDRALIASTTSTQPARRVAPRL